MTALARWNPFEQIEQLQNRFSSFFDTSPVRNGYHSESSAWTPLVDIVESDQDYLIIADVPGVSKDQLTVTLEGRDLVLRATEPTAIDLAEGAEYLIRQRPGGSMSYRFTLPTDADASQVRAELKNGVLSISVPKDERAKPRAIAVISE